MEEDFVAASDFLLVSEEPEFRDEYGHFCTEDHLRISSLQQQESFLLSNI